MFDVTEDELEAGAIALQSEQCICDRGIDEWGRYHLVDPECLICNDPYGMVKAMLKGMLPLIGERLEAQAAEQATTMIAAVVSAAGGRVAVPENVYREAEHTVLTRYDDLSTMSIVFETPHQVPDVA